MKRFFEFIFIALILVTLLFGTVGVTPASAASSTQIVPLSLPAGWRSGYLYDVWGSSDTDVYAVGYGDNGTANMPLLYHKDGDTWAISTLVLPVGWSEGLLFGVWGPSSTETYAVGYGYNGSNDVPLLYHKVGGEWVPSALPLPNGVNSGGLYSIWGSGAEAVYAVGYGFAGNALVPLLFENHGAGWTAASVPVETGWSSIGFRGVWGASASDVYLVGFGYNGNTNLPLIYHKSGSDWSVLSPPVPSGTGSGYLSGIWGSGTTVFYAAGYGYNGSTYLPLVYQESNGSWADANLSLPNGVNSGSLYDIWGSGAEGMYVVGSGNSGNTRLPLMFSRSGGSWIDVSPSSPLGWLSGSLFGVWGSDINHIYAVGAGNNGIAELPLLYQSGQGGQDLVAPGNVADLAASPGTANGSANLSWTAPADDDGSAVAAYLVKYSTSPFTDWSQGTAVTTGIPTPASPGTNQTMSVSGLIPDTLYYFAIRAQDEQYNLSAGFDMDSTTSQGGSQVPGIVNLITPSLSVNTSRPTYTWNVDNNATQYYLWVDGPSGNIIKQWYTSAQAKCSGSTCSVTPSITLGAGDYTWWIQTWNSAGSGPWSSGMGFTASPLPLPAKATLISPTGNSGNNSPTYTWNQVSSATWYYLWVDGPSGNILKEWYTSIQANCNGTTCSVTPAKTLSAGAHTWWIQTWNSAGYGPWSNGVNFTAPVPVLPGRATLVSPAGSTNNNSPTYTWNQVSGATWYYLWVDGPSGNVIKQWYASTEANCNGSRCSVTPSVTLDAGGHTWWIQTWNSTGYGPWSARVEFSTQAPVVPGGAVLISPSGSISSTTPTYSWNQVNGATWYYLWVSGPSGAVIQKWYNSAQANCNGNTCSVTPVTGLSAGAHTWWIQTYNALGYGLWSTQMDFRVSP